MTYCALCRIIFSSEESFDQHLAQASEHKFDCRFCKRHFESQFAHDQHFKKCPVHSECCICRDNADLESGLGVAGLRMCKKCLKNFTSMSEFEGEEESGFEEEVSLPFPIIAPPPPSPVSPVSLTHMQNVSPN